MPSEQDDSLATNCGPTGAAQLDVQQERQMDPGNQLSPSDELLSSIEKSSITEALDSTLPVLE